MLSSAIDLIVDGMRATRHDFVSQKDIYTAIHVAKTVIKAKKNNQHSTFLYTPVPSSANIYFKGPNDPIIFSFTNHVAPRQFTSSPAYITMSL